MAKIKVKYVQLEPAAFLSDLDVQLMNAEEFGVYSRLIFFLYANGGQCLDDAPSMASLTNCSQNFENVWKKVSRKFYKRDGFIRHKRVDKEIKAAQVRHNKAVKAAKAKHTSTAQSVLGAEHEQCQRNVTKDKINNITNTKRKRKGISLLPNSFRLDFLTNLEKILPTTTKSDKSAFRNISVWVESKILAGENKTLLPRKIYQLAEQAKKGNKPIALFFDLLKKELNYIPPSTKVKEKL